MLDAIVRDIRQSLRNLRQTPTVTVAALMTLALGIGANTAIFSLVDRVMLRTLPVREPAALVMVVDTSRTGGFGAAESWSNPVWEQLRSHLHGFGGGFAWSETQFNLAAGGEAQMVEGLWVSGGFFDTLGVPAFMGRTFTADDDKRGGGADGAVAVISHDFWQRHLGGAPDAIGRSLTIGGVSFRVIGVTPPGFSGIEVGRAFDVALPLGIEPLLVGSRASALDLAGRYWLRMMLRLAPGQTLNSATAVLRAIQPQIRDATLPAVPGEMVNAYMRGPMAVVAASRGWSRLRTQFQQPLVVLMAVVAIVLLIACANVANLLLARATARRHDVRVRLALGASRLRLARQFVIESVLLATVGAALGLLLARWMARLLLVQLSTDVSHVSLDLSFDWRVLGFTTAVGFLTALICGTVPAWRSTDADSRESLNEQVRWPGGAQSRVAGTLIVTQVALSLVLVVAAGLFTRTFAALATRDLGFTTNRTLIAELTTPMTRFKPEELTTLYQRALEAVAAVPGVERAALSDVTPVSGAVRNVPIIMPGDELPERDRLALVNVVSPDWFSTYGTRLLAGRDFTSADREGSVRVGIVNDAFARRFLNGENPVGRTIRDGFGAGMPVEIVGHVVDAVYRSIRDEAQPTLYTAFAQRTVARPFVSITLRSSTASPGTLTRSLAAAVAGVSPALVVQFRPLTDQVNAQLARERVVALLASFFATLALLLAALGLYGVTTHAVTRRRSEIGIRIALGAQYSGIIRMVLRRVAFLLIVGIAAGSALSWWASRYLSVTLLYGLEPRDPGTLAGSAATLAFVGLVAGWIPARRAASLNPIEALRVE